MISKGSKRIFMSENGVALALSAKFNKLLDLRKRKK